MCGGISLNFSDIPEGELAQYFLPQEIDAFRKTGLVESFFWSRRPVLPVILPGKSSKSIRLFDWGNRDKDVDLPRTGWAREESISAGRWRHLHPADILIPARQGYEKKVWFEITGLIAGVLVEKDEIVRAYMITIPSDPEYLALTGHDRMPKIEAGWR